MARPGGTLVTLPIADTGLYVSFLASGSLYQMLSQKRGQRRVRWSEVERIMERYYAQMATELQQMVVDILQDKRERPDVSTGRLDAATLDSRNRRVDKAGFGVGVHTWLDRSEAKYWRQIEEGYQGHIGRHLYGLFGDTLTGRWNRYASGRSPQAGPEWSFVGLGTGGKFQPKKRLPAAVRRQHFAGPRKTEAGDSRSSRMIIKKGIDATNAYGLAYQRFRKSSRAFWLFRQVVMSELGLSSDQVPRSYQGIVNDVF